MKKHMLFFSFLTLLTLTFSSCGNQQKTEVVEVEPIDMANLRIEIQAIEDAFAASEKAKDADAVAAYYSEDAVSHSRNKQPISGKSAINLSSINKESTD
jgi:hypothetical protein